MKKQLFFSFLLLITQCYGEVFSDPFSGITFEIPKGFQFSERESKLDRNEKIWWYVFSDSQKNLISVEVEECDQNTSLSDLFELTTLDEDEELESIIYDGMEFKDMDVEEMEITECKLRILAISEKHLQPVYFCDYLFVEGNFSYSINLIKKEKDQLSRNETEAMMLDLLKSVRFQSLEN